VNIFAPVRDYVDTLVHPSAQQDAAAAVKHRAFIEPRLLASFAALAAFPVYLTIRGVPSVAEVLLFAWFVAPLAAAYFLSRTGRYEAAHVLSSLAFTVLAAAVAIETGGIASFTAIWLVVVPLEAALSGSRRVIAIASMFAISAAGLLAVLGSPDLPAVLSSIGTQQGALAALGIISAVLYAMVLALRAEALTQSNSGLLYAEEDRYRLLARNMTDVITRHGRNGAVLFVSPAAEPLFGAKVHDLLGHGLFDRVHVADRPAYLTALGDTAALGEGRSVEFRIRREAGEGTAVQFVWIEMRCRPLDSASGEKADPEMREVVAVLRDVSRRKAQEAALEEARAESDRANAAKSLFVATMSHELRTPLNVIIGFSEMLTKEAPMLLDAARRQEYAQLINESGHHLLSVVNGILDMSKIEAGNFEITPEPFAPARVIKNCCDLLGLKASEAGIDVVMCVAEDIPEIVADKRALNQILLNLLSNAIKFTGRGGHVTVTAKQEASSFLLTVEDTGVGISPEDLPHIGDPFFQARAQYYDRHEGTGLGLSIVKGLAALHGGDLQISSRLGEGTCVTLRLPIDCERAGKPKQRKREPRPLSIGTVAPDLRVRKIA
jgi:cell cycle sensor histidine kinase DivJ